MKPLSEVAPAAWSFGHSDPDPSSVTVSIFAYISLLTKKSSVRIFSTYKANPNC